MNKEGFRRLIVLGTGSAALALAVAYGSTPASAGGETFRVHIPIAGKFPAPDAPDKITTLVPMVNRLWPVPGRRIINWRYTGEIPPVSTYRLAVSRGVNDATPLELLVPPSPNSANGFAEVTVPVQPGSHYQACLQAINQAGAGPVRCIDFETLG